MTGAVAPRLAPPERREVLAPAEVKESAWASTTFASRSGLDVSEPPKST
ncbi:MAG: hypothetical protein HOO96_21190 [Polyangiaceae bacterium]|nr:hypothetical protein [Polyangiaceae bacterium]